jgi:hypothetical protein
MLRLAVIAVAVVVGLVLFLIVSVTLDYINFIGWDLWLKIIRSRRAIRRLLKASYPNVKVWSLGASHIDPKHFCICIDVESDMDRDTLIKDAEMERQMRASVLQTGYPSESVPILPFSIQSMETINRDFGGSSWHARK